MEQITNFLDNLWKTKALSSIITVIVSLILYKGISFILERGEKKDKFKVLAGKKTKTYIKLTRSIIRYVFIAVTILTLLQINGIDVSSVLAGVGILGVIFGLAIQDWLKDIIRGSSILSDDYFSVGDLVKYKEIEGKVLVLGLKSTKIQDIKTGNIISIANRNIEEIEVLSNLIYINIPMPYELPVQSAEKVIEKIIFKIKNNTNVNDCNYKGVNELADSSIKYLIEVTYNQPYKLQVRRDALRTILLEMDKNGISVPYTQIDIHEK